MYLCHRPHQSHYTKHKSAKSYVPLPTPTTVTIHKTQTAITYVRLLPPTAVTLHKRHISRLLCTLATAHTSHITQNTNQHTLMYPCHSPQQSIYTKHNSANPYVPLHIPHKSQYSKHKSGKPYVHLPLPKAVTLHNTQKSANTYVTVPPPTAFALQIHKSENPYVDLPTPTTLTLHKTQISKTWCTFSTAHTSLITQNTKQLTLMYLCHSPQQLYYTKHKSANPYVPLPPPTAITLHKTQISNPLCTLAGADKIHITQNSNQQTHMYPCHRSQHSHYTKHKSANAYVPLPPPTTVTLHKTQISKPVCILATALSSHITQNTNEQTLM